MTYFTRRSNAFLLVLALLLTASPLFSQNANSSHSAVLRPVAPNNTTVELSRNGNWNSGSGNYVWTLHTAPAAYTGGVSFGSYTNSGNGSTVAQVTVTFTATAVPGNYTFRLTRGSVFADVSVVLGNIAAANSSNPISAFAVDPSNSGNLLNPNPADIFSPTVNTAALGVDEQGRFYFVPNTSSNSGVFTLYGTNANGNNITLINSGTDMNGSSGNSLGFVRLAIRQDGQGYMIAADGSSVFVTSFTANGTSATTVNPSSTVSIVNGSVSDFQNGDLCFSADGTMFALANDGSGNTYIYTGNAPYTTLTKKWTLVAPGGAPFTGSVNGVAFDILGSLYLSSSTGLYYIDQTTVNSFGTGTVTCTQKWAGSGLTDLASNAFPQQTTLPVKWGNFSVQKQGSDAKLNWTTLQEINHSHFEIERSEDGIHFNKVGQVNGAGNSQSVRSYQFTDVLTGITARMVYYRLKDLAVDGRSSYSRIISLRLDGGKQSGLQVYPNPFMDHLKLNIRASQDEKIQVRISNLGGQQVSVQTMQVQTGENVLVIGDLQKLQAGIYIMEIISSGERTVLKVNKR